MIWYRDRRTNANAGTLSVVPKYIMVTENECWVRIEPNLESPLNEVSSKVCNMILIYVTVHFGKYGSHQHDMPHYDGGRVRF